MRQELRAMFNTIDRAECPSGNNADYCRNCEAIFWILYRPEFDPGSTPLRPNGPDAYVSRYVNENHSSRLCKPR